MSEQRWRVVDATGAVREVSVMHPDGGRWAVCGRHLRGAGFGDTRDEAISAWLSMEGDVREILAPGVPTRAEAVAAARREGAAEMLTRCRDAAREAFDAHPLTLDRYHEPGCIHDAIGRGSCSECDRGEAIVTALRALPLPGDATPDAKVTP